MSNLGEYVAHLRMEKGWSQKELARKASLSQGTIQKIESKATESPKINVLIAIAKAFRVPVIKLINEYQGKSLEEAKAWDAELLSQELQEAIDKVLKKHI